MPKGIYIHKLNQGFQKGHKDFVPKEFREKMKERFKGNGNPFYGKKHSKMTILQQSKIKKGKHFSPKTEFKKGKINERRGKEFLQIKGEKHWNWKGGISENPYPKEFNLILKLKIRTRDNFTCCLCGKTEAEELKELNRVLCVNHINYDKNNCEEENLNTLCLRCNIKVNKEREFWINYFKQCVSA